MEAETFPCPNCDTDIPGEESLISGPAVCPNCGHRYLVEYDDLMDCYQLRADEPPQYPTDIDTDRI
jgi:hypothetical protein